jgi:predicted GNAT family acetyltransferase
MTIDLIHETGRVYALDDTGSLMAEISFPETAPGRVTINHTYVRRSLRGHGVGNKLVRAAINSIRDGGLKAVATCPFAIKWLDEHPDERDVLME